MAVSILLVRALVEAVEGLGIERQRFFARSEFDGARIEDGEGRLTLAEYDALCEHALDATGDPALGLHMGETLNATTHNLAAHLVAHAPTMRAGIDSLLRFHRLLTDHQVWHLVEDGGTASLLYEVLDGVPRCRRFRAEISMVGFFRMVRYFGRGELPRRVSFVHPAPGYRAEYERIFEGRAEFESESTRIDFDAALLSAPQLNQDAEFHAILSAQAERRVSRSLTSAPYADRVRGYLIECAATARSDMDSVSRAVGLSTRSLRRRLGEEGTSYGHLVTEARTILAKQLLASADRTITEAAYELGFSDPSAFHRAFKRWTGATPSEFRRARPA